MDQYEAEVLVGLEYNHGNNMDGQPEVQQASGSDNDGIHKQREQDRRLGDNNVNKQREIQQDSTYNCDYSDTDRLDMLSNYASETYLQRWSQDTGDKEELLETTQLMNPQHSGSKLNIIENNSLEETAQLDTAVDYDGMSLVSYNSVAMQDRGSAPVTRNCTDTCHSPYRLDVGEETASAWKGYGGNIYFDPLNCQQLRILTSKLVKTHAQTHKASGKEHSLHQDKKYKLQHKSCLPIITGSNNTFVSHTGNTELGSLRMDQTSRQRNRATESLKILGRKGKICKGFSERIVVQTLRKVREPKRCVSAPEPLVVSGLNSKALDSGFDLISGVTKCNTKIRAAEFGLHGRNNFPIIFSAGKMMQYSNGTFLESLSLPTLSDDLNQNITTSTGRKQNSPETVLAVQEPKPVLIIPFGAFDDPVADQESLVPVSLKKKQKKEKLKKPKPDKNSDRKKNDLPSEHDINEKENIKTKSCMPGSCTENEKQKLVSKSAPVTRQCYQERSTQQQDDKVCQETLSDHTEPTSTIPPVAPEVLSQYRNTAVRKQHIGKFQNVHCLHKQTKIKKTLVVPQVTSTSPEAERQFKREISNASLTNYLSAVSPQSPQLVEARQVAVPRLSYTKRARPLYSQTASGCLDGSQYFAEFNQSEMNNGQLLAQSPTLRGGYNSAAYNSDQRRQNKQFKVMLSTSDKVPDNSCTSSRSQGLGNSTSPRQGVLKRTSSLTKSAPRLGVKFSLDSPGTTGGRLGINRTEYQLPTISRQSGTS